MVNVVFSKQIEYCIMTSSGFFTDLPSLLTELCQSARRAGTSVLDIYDGLFDVDLKSDNSPVTAADLASEEIILSDLSRLCPSIRVISEEAHARSSDPANSVPDRLFFLVDPLDGTKEFVARNGDFTINIALIEDGKPIMGVVYAPALGRMYAGIVGEGACFYQENDVPHPIHVRRPPPDGLVVVASRSHAAPEQDRKFLERYTISETKRIGSSLKFCLLAEGIADLYPRFSPTMEWDTAAGHAVLKAAGGRVVTANGYDELTYGKSSLRIPAFIAWGGTPS